MKIKFLPQNIEVEGTPDKSLLQIATENHLEIRSICKGVPSCAECRVRIAEGDNNVLPPGKAELSLIGTSYFIDGRRLSCQVRCFGDVTVDLTEQVERAENQTKKIRGYRSNKHVESTAVNDTMLLDQKVDEKAETPQHQPQEHVEAKEGAAPAPRPQQQQQQARPKQQHPNQNQNQNRPKQGGGGQQQQRPPQQKGQQQGKQQQNKPQQNQPKQQGQPRPQGQQQNQQNKPQQPKQNQTPKK